MKNYYEILGVSEEATPEEIKVAYKRLAKKHHPDCNQGSRASEEKFKEVSEAYEVLSDVEKRRKYDGARRLGTGQNFGTTNGFDIADLFQQFNFGGQTRGFRSGSSFAEVLDEAFFGETMKESGHGPADLRIELTIPFEKAIKGGDVEFSYDNGSPRKLRVKIPSGIEDGKEMRLGGQGYAGRQERGDLILTIRVKPDPIFARKGLDIYYDHTINIAQAIFGSAARIRTVFGDKIDVKIPPATECGTVFKLAKLGVKSEGRVGDMYVTARVEIPKNLSKKQKEQFQQFALSYGLEF